MMHFTFRSFEPVDVATLFPKLALYPASSVPETDWRGAETGRTETLYKPANPRQRYKEPRNSLPKATPMRPYAGMVPLYADRWGRNRIGTQLSQHDREKATEYARWLAARDGRKLPDAEPVVAHRHVPLNGYRSGVYRAESVTFGSVVIAIPHVDYDPTLPAIENGQ